MYGTTTDPVEIDNDEVGKLLQFEARIARGEKIEPGDWMPPEYRRQLIRMISQHAHSEIVGQLPEGAWITRAPSLRRKMILLAKVQDEAGHGQYLYHAAETLGATREELQEALLTGRAKYSNIFNYPTLSWADVGVIGYLVDFAAILNQTMLAHCSYGPYARAMVRICMEENFHKKQGQDIVITLARGTRHQKAMLQDAINRWWWPTLMMFGPPDNDSPNSAILIRWGIKTRSNDELRQDFLNKIVPELHDLGLTLPDPELRYDEEVGNWCYGAIRWDEFWQVIQGKGPCNKERMEARIRAHEDGRWVREAVEAYTQKKWPRFQVFVQEKSGAPHEDAGSVHAPDAEMALLNARDVFARRPACVSMWVVPVESIYSKTAQELGNSTSQRILDKDHPGYSSESASRESANSDHHSESDQQITGISTYEVFCKVKEAGTQTHVGEVEASSPEQAMERAVEKYSQVRKPLVWWVCPAHVVTQSKPDEVESMYAPARDKTFRMSTDFHTVSAMRQIRDGKPTTKDDR